MMINGCLAIAAVGTSRYSYVKVKRSVCAVGRLRVAENRSSVTSAEILKASQKFKRKFTSVKSRRRKPTAK